MKKKILVCFSWCVFLAVVLVVSLSFALVACGDDDRSKCRQQQSRYTIVYIGDSIAEALIGPSPLGERDNYGYYALVGRVNGFNYYNHSVSGHLTSGGMAGNTGLLEMLKRDDENAVLMKTHLQEADMIHVSVLGNNMLQYNLGLLMLEVADPEFEQRYEEGTTLINALEDGSLDEPVERDSLDSFESDGSPRKVKFAFPPTYQDLCDIVARLRELNPAATIVFQKVYNPFYENCKHLSRAVYNKLATITDEDGQYGEAGLKITTIEQLRRVADKLLGKLNGLLDRYLKEHNGDEFIILDAQAEFERVTQMGLNEYDEVDLSERGLGRSLIYEDWTHPSNFGHAVLAGLTQKLLDELGLSSPDAVANYKAIKKEQIRRMYFMQDDFDAAAALSAINSAETFFDVTMAYFTAINDHTPIY